MHQQHPPPEGDTRARAWTAAVGGPDRVVVVRYEAVREPDEELTETPETWELTWAEWRASHSVVYGLELDGTPTGILAERRAAWRMLRRMANGTTPFTENEVRDAFGAVRRIQQDLAAEVKDS